MLVRSMIVSVALAAAPAAHAHGIAGNRLFPGTITFDDPAVADELQIWTVGARHSSDNLPSFVVHDQAIYGSFQRLLTDELALGINSGGIYRSGGSQPPRAGFDRTSLSMKQLVFKDELHETLISASLSWGIGGSGSQRVGASASNSLSPAISFGKGFGDLPDSLSWLRPFAVTGAVAFEVPIGPRSRTIGDNPIAGKIGTVASADVPTLHWGFAVEYSPLYLTDRFTPGQLPKSEPLHQFVPLVEFAFDTPRGQKTAATMNPGLAYVADVWQVSAEAVVPLNSQGGRGLGFRTEILIFLDDFAPSIFGKPLLSR
ncbi:hypothetical protein [Methylobacterium sp. JK268]